MMTDAFKQLLSNQYAASLSTLGHCITMCPDTTWGTLVAKYPFYQVAFHTLIFTDLYLDTDEKSFRRQPFHLANTQLFRDYEQLEDREPVLMYDRFQVLTYWDFCSSKVAARMAIETESTLCTPTTFARRNVTRAEMHLLNVRHIQHHAAQLALRLRLDSAADVPWIDSGWKVPTLAP